MVVEIGNDLWQSLRELLVWLGDCLGTHAVRGDDSEGGKRSAAPFLPTV